MKTTLEISDNLFKEAKRLVSQQGKTMREIVEESLRLFLDSRKKAVKPFKWRHCPFKGEGMAEGLHEGNWETVRDVIYEGRGSYPIK